MYMDSSKRHNDIVSTDEFVRAGGRIVHLPRSRGRVLTIAYWRDRLEGNIYFAGSMYTPDDACPEFGHVRKGNNQTAVSRCLSYGWQAKDPCPFDPEKVLAVQEEQAITERFLSDFVLSSRIMRDRKTELAWGDMFGFMTQAHKNFEERYPEK